MLEFLVLKIIFSLVDLAINKINKPRTMVLFVFDFSKIAVFKGHYYQLVLPKIEVAVHLPTLFK